MHSERTFLNPVTPISWGAIFAGAVIISVAGIMLSTFGASFGLWNMNFSQGEAPFKTLGIGAVIWWVITALISTFIGAWVSGRLAGSPIRLDAALHGIMSWSVAMLVAMFMMAAVTGAILSGVFGVVSNSAQALGKGVGQAAQAFDIQMLPPELQEDIKSLFGDIQQEVNGQTFQQAFRALMPILRKGPQNVTQADKEKLAKVVVQRTNVTREEALQKIDKTLEDFQNMPQQLQDFREKAQKTVDETAETAGKATLAGFIIQLLSVLMAALGGISGAKSLPSRSV